MSEKSTLTHLSKFGPGTKRLMLGMIRWNKQQCPTSSGFTSYLGNHLFLN